jgi:hypothetical protein
MTRIAAGPESMDVEDWMPSKIYLSVPLMWEVLQFKFMADSQEIPSAGLLDASLTPTVAHEEANENTTLEIIVATSPEISINTSNGGQEAPTLSYKAPTPSVGDSSWNTGYDEISAEQTDSLTPWLYADSAQFANANIGDMGHHDSNQTMGEDRWWEADNFNSIMFNQF